MENPTNTSSPNQPLGNTEIILGQPNIVLITVDQLRYPMHFASLKEKFGIETADQFVQQFMPNLYHYLWEPGAKFSNYYTAASDCTAARATIHTGLYAYQTYSMLTLISYPPDEPTQPVLHKDFPTIGHLMGDAGYLTPYFGKWHLSYDVADLTDYGYTSFTPNQDYPGYAGEGQATDDAAAYEAARWINDYVRDAKNKSNTNPAYVPQPFCLTLNFVNPHDKQWFWGAMQADDFYAVYDAVHKTYPTEVAPGPYIQVTPQDQPPQVYHDDINTAILNFQDQDALNAKPLTQTLVKEVFQYQMGGIYEEDQKTPQNYTSVTAPSGFYYANAPSHKPDHKAVAPHKYWSRALDSYVQVMKMVDHSIGNFMSSVSEEVRKNTIFIFTSDHGEYGSSHGLQGKGGTVYEEGIRVPLIVRDSRPNSYVNSPNLVRNQLASSVDLLPMIVTMGNGGNTAWMQGNKYEELYGHGKRGDLLSLLGTPTAPGRTYALHTTDEFVPKTYNFNSAPLHVIGLIQANPDGTNKRKLGVYTTWAPYTSSQAKATVINPMAQTPIMIGNMEFYNAADEVLEINSTPGSSEAQTANLLLFGTLLGSELQATLPTQTLRDAQTFAYTQLIEYMALVDELAKPKTQAAAASSSGDARRLVSRAWAF
jgi:uncharacterized sulfatase